MKVSIVYAHPLSRLVLGSDLWLGDYSVRIFWGLSRFSSQAEQILKEHPLAKVGFSSKELPGTENIPQFTFGRIRPVVIEQQNERVVMNYLEPERKYLANCLYMAGVRGLEIQGPASKKEIKGLIGEILELYPELVKLYFRLDDRVKFREEILPLPIGSRSFHVYDTFENLQIIKSMFEKRKNIHSLDIDEFFKDEWISVGLFLYYHQCFGMAEKISNLIFLANLLLENTSLSSCGLALVLANVPDKMIFRRAYQFLQQRVISETDSEILLTVLAGIWRKGRIDANSILEIVEEIVRNQPISKGFLKRMYEKKWFFIDKYGGQQYFSDDIQKLQVIHELSRKKFAS